MRPRHNREGSSRDGVCAVCRCNQMWQREPSVQASHTACVTHGTMRFGCSTRHGAFMRFSTSNIRRVSAQSSAPQLVSGQIKRLATLPACMCPLASASSSCIAFSRGTCATVEPVLHNVLTAPRSPSARMKRDWGRSSRRGGSCSTNAARTAPLTSLRGRPPLVDLLWSSSAAPSQAGRPCCSDHAGERLPQPPRLNLR